ncbi:TRIM66 [Mytilus coruscus]|uniref:TRIM66 n=1 Tax=Mytilus coruscus TaxID=42192 RepID=A0A6J8CWR4_MYTCO|nr:TRIM66 [Mytilus coruscus]
MTCICTYCKRFFCDDCIREHRKEFPDHVFVLRENITRGLEYQGEILIDFSEEFDLSKFDVCHVMDMKSVKGMVVIIMYMNRNCFLRVYSALKGTQKELQNQMRIELDQKKSQMTIIDENTVAITVPCKSHIQIVNFKTDMITTINDMTMMTGAIAFIDKNLYVASIRHIRTMNLQGEILANIGLPDIQMLHPLGHTKLYCVSSNPQKHISYIDMTNKEEHHLLEFPFHLKCLTSDELSDIYFISNRTLWKAKHDGEDSIVVLSNLGSNSISFRPETICFDISKKLLLVQTSCTEIKIYRKN